MKQAIKSINLSDYLSCSEAIDEAKIMVRQYASMGYALTVRILGETGKCIKIVK